jgi:hypothetical protein
VLVLEIDSDCDGDDEDEDETQDAGENVEDAEYLQEVTLEAAAGGAAIGRVKKCNGVDGGVGDGTREGGKREGEQQEAEQGRGSG